MVAFLKYDIVFYVPTDSYIIEFGMSHPSNTTMMMGSNMFFVHIYTLGGHGIENSTCVSFWNASTHDLQK